MSTALERHIATACTRARIQEPDLDKKNERARAFIASLSGQLEHDYPELSAAVWAVLHSELEQQS